MMDTHNLCFRAKIRNYVYPCKPQFYYICIKVGSKGYKFHGRVCMMGIIEHFPGYLRFHATCTSMFKDNSIDKNPTSTILSWQQ